MKKIILAVGAILAMSFACFAANPESDFVYDMAPDGQGVMITSKKLTAERIAEIEKVPITYDEDSPKFTKEELQEFVPYHKEYFDITPKKVLISFKIDADILAIMKATGKGYQTRMNKCLREAVKEGRF